MIEVRTTGRNFDPGLEIAPAAEVLDFVYGKEVFHPAASEHRFLHDVRASLSDPEAAGPDVLYAIAMGVGRRADETELQRRNLLFGIVLYEAGAIGEGPVRSQGHVHAVSPHNGWRAPELIEVWLGHAVVLLQEWAAGDPGRCYAIEAAAGECVVVPPGWAHAVINASRSQRMMFGAFCDREYGFEYGEVRARNGLAWEPRFTADGRLQWTQNELYPAPGQLTLRRARAYPELGLTVGVPLYKQYLNDPASVQWVSDPSARQELWKTFVP